MSAVAIGLAVRGARLGRTGGHLALLPVRAAGRVPVVGRAADVLAQDGRRSLDEGRELLEGVAVRVLSGPEVEQVAARVLDAVDLDRIVEAVLADPRTESLIVRVLESRLVDEVTERVLVSPELQRIVEHFAESAEIRDAVRQQTHGFADEVVTDVRRRSENADDAIERRVRGWMRRPRPALP